MNQPVQIHNLTLHRADCMDIMRRYPDGWFDLAIVDPPYGLNIAKEKPRASGRWNYTPKQWDSSTPTNDYFAEMKRVSRHQIIWGGNYFQLPPARCWIVWDKEQSVKNFAAAELAWTSFDEVVSMFRFSFTANNDKIHVTQKPVALYRWILTKYATPGQRILDTHLGSGSSAIACHYANCHLVACEIDPDYFSAAVQRISNETQQTEFPSTIPTPPSQPPLFP